MAAMLGSFMPSGRNVTLLIALGYALVMALVITMGTQIISTIDRLQSISHDLYLHPFKVSNAALEAQAKIVLVRNVMLEEVLHGDARESRAVLTETTALDGAIRDKLKIARSAFLGDTRRVDDVIRHLDEWSQLRSHITDLLEHGRHERARELAVGPGEKIFAQLAGDMAYVVDFARHKAASYAEEASRESAQRMRTIWQLMGVLAVLVTLLVLAITRRVLQEFRQNEEFARDLLENEQKFRLLFESGIDGKLLLSADGRIVDVNHVAYERLGYRREEMLGRHIAEFNSPQYAEKAAQIMAQIRAQGHASFESAHVRKDGTVIPMEVSSMLIELRGEPMFYSISRDVSERRKFENELAAREARYRAVIETSADGFWVVDMQGRLVEVNDAYVRLSGYRREELLAMRVPDLEVRERPEETAAHIEMILREGHDRFETVHRRKDGSTWPVEIVTNYWPEVGGYLFVFAIDITERKRREEDQKLAAAVFQNIGEALTVTDAQNRIIAVNPAFTQLTGYTPQEVIGNNPNMLSSGHHDSEFYRQMWQSLEQTGQWQGEIWDRRKDGSLMAEWLTISTIYDADGKVDRRVALFSDITKKKQSEEVIWRQANFDALTQLPNRRMFHERLEQEIRKAHRTEQGLALLFIDLDHFKEINDTLGHHFGDELLMEAARRITACVRESDAVARLGGDEFTVILADLADDAHVERVAQDIMGRLSAPFSLGSERAYVSASIGITLYPEDASDAAGLLRNCRPGDVCRQERRAQPLQLFHAPAAGKGAEAAAPDQRPALGGDRGAAAGLLPAHRRSGEYAYQQGGGAAALAASRAGDDQPAGFHSARRGNRHDQRNRRLGIHGGRALGEALDREVRR
jgi:diguanylate cyclase (GGDEF)-like protein/PAS domain S-box-containing protein